MTAAVLPLDRMQRWLQAVIVHPGETKEALASTAAAAEVPAGHVADVILPSATLTPTERLGVYHGMYLLRMHDALASDYAALKHFLGDPGFFGLVRDYVQVYPSRSHSLNRLGDHLPEFLKNAPDFKRRDFCVDLARLECAIAQVFDAPETKPLSQDEIAAVAPEAWEHARLLPIEAFRLMTFQHPVNAYLQTVRDENHDHPKPRRKPEWVAIYRREYAVYRLDLSRDGHDLLADLTSGVPLGEAIGLALKRGGRKALGEDQLFKWFRDWVSGGVFRAVELR
jgi:Putative DNA-binding domain